jgi:hypothetical protein
LHEEIFREVGTDPIGGPSVALTFPFEPFEDRGKIIDLSG